MAWRHQLTRLARGFLILVVGLSVTGAQSEAQRHRGARRPAPFPADEIDSIVAASRADDGIPGVAVAIGHGNGQTFEEAWGWMSIAGFERAHTDSIFQWGSLTKQFTAAAIMRLEEQGGLDIEDDIDTYIPEIAPRSFGVTIEQLMTHTSGLPNYMETTLNPWNPLTSQEVFEWLLVNPKRFDPGEEWEYNNIGYYLLGVIIERASGVTYPEFLEQEFFLPLGLAETAYCGRPPASEIPNGYVGLEGIPIPIDAMDMSIPFAAGALCGTAEDLVRWNRALSSGTAVSQASYEQMTTAARLNSGELTDYGFGVGVDTVEGFRVIAHSGTIPGFNTHLLYIPDLELTIAVLTNLFPLSGNLAGNIARQIAYLFEPSISKNGETSYRGDNPSVWRTGREIEMTNGRNLRP